MALKIEQDKAVDLVAEMGGQYELIVHENKKLKHTLLSRCMDFCNKKRLARYFAVWLHKCERTAASMRLKLRCQRLVNTYLKDGLHQWRYNSSISRLNSEQNERKSLNKLLRSQHFCIIESMISSIITGKLYLMVRRRFNLWKSFSMSIGNDILLAAHSMNITNNILVSKCYHAWAFRFVDSSKDAVRRVGCILHHRARKMLLLSYRCWWDAAISSKVKGKAVSALINRLRHTAVRKSFALWTRLPLINDKLDYMGKLCILEKKYFDAVNEGKKSSMVYSHRRLQSVLENRYRSRIQRAYNAFRLNNVYCRMRSEHDARMHIEREKTTLAASLALTCAVSLFSALKKNTFRLQSTAFNVWKSCILSTQVQQLTISSNTLAGKISTMDVKLAEMEKEKRTYSISSTIKLCFLKQHRRCLWHIFYIWSAQTRNLRHYGQVDVKIKRKLFETVLSSYHLRHRKALMLTRFHCWVRYTACSSTAHAIKCNMMYDIAVVRKEAEQLLFESVQLKKSKEEVSSVARNILLQRCVSVGYRNVVMEYFQRWLSSTILKTLFYSILNRQRTTNLADGFYILYQHGKYVSSMHNQFIRGDILLCKLISSRNRAVIRGSFHKWCKMAILLKQEEEAINRKLELARLMNEHDDEKVMLLNEISSMKSNAVMDTDAWKLNLSRIQLGSIIKRKLLKQQYISFRRWLQFIDDIREDVFQAFQEESNASQAELMVEVDTIMLEVNRLQADVEKSREETHRIRCERNDAISQLNVVDAKLKENGAIKGRFFKSCALHLRRHYLLHYFHKLSRNGYDAQEEKYLELKGHLLDEVQRIIQEADRLKYDVIVTKEKIRSVRADREELTSMFKRRLLRNSLLRFRTQLAKVYFSQWRHHVLSV